MVVIAAVVGGYILAHENLKLPSWVPVLGHTYFTLDAEFQTAQAVTPGQGQAVTIAGAKIGEIASVDLHNGIALVTMNVNAEIRAVHLPQRDAAAAPEDAAAGHHVEVNPGHPVRRQTAQRRGPAGHADRAEHRLRRIPRRARRRNARLPAGAARRPGRSA